MPKTTSPITAIAFESRMADSTSKLLERKDIQTLSAPSMQEVPLEDHTAVFSFAEKLLAGQIDILICTTGVGTKMMIKTLRTKYKWEDILHALREIIIVARGPKPAKVCRRMDIPIALKVPEPNTWKEILETLSQHKSTSNLQGKEVAIQEYGRSNEQLNEALRKQGATLTLTSIYRWTLPDDPTPLKKGIQAIIDGNVQLVLFTSKTQADHVMKLADQMGIKQRLQEAFKKTFIASIGPVCSKGLRAHDIHANFEPSRSKLAIFINEVAEESKKTIKPEM